MKWIGGEKYVMGAKGIGRVAVLGALFCAGPLLRAGESSVLVIVMDGLRPDYVTPELMPELHNLGLEGVIFEDHHAVYPTVTRVNSPSIATGAYPRTHGLMGNSVYFREMGGEVLSTKVAANLQKIDAATGGNLLTAPSLGEILENRSERLLAVSSGSSGSAFLLNHKGAGEGVVATEIVWPARHAERVTNALGQVPEDTRPDRDQNAWVVDAYFTFGLSEPRVAVTLMWLTDPDHTAHDFGIGGPETLEALRLVDGEIGRIREAHRHMGIEGEVNIIVTSDHGFSTRVRRGSLNDVMEAGGVLDAVSIADGTAIYLREGDRALRDRIVRMLQAEPSVGAIFTAGKKPGSMKGSAKGTMSFHSVHWDHERAADILASANWTEEKNEYGYAGVTVWGDGAGHGSTSPYDIGATLVANGPAFKSGLRSGVPTGNVDIAPTVCYLLGIPLPGSMEGRVLHEAIVGGPDPGAVEVRTKVRRVRAGKYRLELSESVVDGKRYVNFTKVRR
jgi:arylsulfatase A-like enzyme